MCYTIRPKTEPHSDLWRGVVGAGVTGFFSPKVTAPYIEVSTLGRSTKLTRHGNKCTNTLPVLKS